VTTCRGQNLDVYQTNKPCVFIILSKLNFKIDTPPTINHWPLANNENTIS